MNPGADHLRFSTEMLKRLGEELGPHPDLGILELVRNAYDADARVCTVELADTGAPGGTIRVTDDGIGMTAESIRGGWLVLGRSGKTNLKTTPKRKRFPIGNKGVGRLAALRLGRTAELLTRPEAEPGAEYRLELDWDAFDSANMVEDVALSIHRADRQPQSMSGTQILIRDLRAPLAESDVRRLARSLVLLSDPFRQVNDAADPNVFKPVLKVPEFGRLEQLVANGYLDEADFHIHATVDASGRAKATVRAYDGKILVQGTHEEIRGDDENYECPEATFDLWWFLLSGKNFSPRTVTLREVREWLGEFGGVHLYHRGMRVSPYSDLDWLDMNLRRNRSPEGRPSTNTSIGKVSVADERGVLLPKTDRMGFVEDARFYDLKQFATDVLDWQAYVFVRRREDARRKKKGKAAARVRRAKKALDRIADSVPEDAKDEAKKAIEEFEIAKQQEVNALREDLQLYRTLGTVGTTTAAFAHQAKAPLAAIASSASTLEQVLTEPGLFYDSELAELAIGIKQNAESTLAFARITLGLLQHEKRRRGSVSIHTSINEVVSLLLPYIKLRAVTVVPALRAARHNVMASKAAMESILTNLFINSLASFERAPPGERIVEVRTRNFEERSRKGNRSLIQLAVLDNGPGIAGIGIKDIWLPGRTTTTEGTGLGLTIVRDIALELGGTVSATARGELGGAEIMINLPVRGGA